MWCAIPSICGCKDKKTFANDLKTLYHAPDEEQGYKRMEQVREIWSEKYPGCMNRWADQWDCISPMFKFSRDVRRVRHLFLRKTKTDRKDSFLLAETLRIGRFSATTLADEDVLCMRQLCRHRLDLVDYIADQKRKIIAVMDRVFPEYQTLFSDMFGKTSTEQLSRAVTSEEVLALSAQEPCDLLNTASRGRFGMAKVEAIQKAARQSFGITIGSTSAFTLQLRQLLEMIALLEKQHADLEVGIDQYLPSMCTFITACPGIGNVLVATILGEIGDITRVPRSRRAAGLDKPKPSNAIPLHPRAAVACFAIHLPRPRHPLSAFVGCLSRLAGALL